MSRNHFNELSPCEALIMKLIWEAPQDIPVQGDFGLPIVELNSSDCCFVGT